MTANKGGAGLIVELTSDVDGIPAGTRVVVADVSAKASGGGGSATPEPTATATPTATPDTTPGADGHAQAAAQAADVRGSG